jgi:NAD(P)-dependent dehydrogenase (short-subunit alcohol dehydrogenase family)
VEPSAPTRFAGKVAFITGGARGQGRSHSLRLAREGADIALVDLGAAGRVNDPHYNTATSAELKKTREDILALGRRCESFEVDVRDYDALARAAADTAARARAS